MAVRRALALVLAVIVSGGCSLAGRSLGGYIDDKLVKGAVKRRLAGADMERSGVTIDTFSGTVYLTGTVETEIDKSNAEIAAWQVEGVGQVVNDLVVRRTGEALSASPALPAMHPLRERLRGVARVEGRPGRPDLAYDARGGLVATVYVLSARDIVDRDIAALRAEGRSIDHVTVFPLLTRPELPAPHFAVVLWHVSELEAAALR